MNESIKITNQGRQGDVMLIFSGKSLPKGANLITKPEDTRVVLALGEVTGHAHQLSTKYASAYESEGKTFVQAKKGATLNHEEHGTIPVVEGVWEVRRQMQYEPQALRFVND